MISGDSSSNGRFPQLRVTRDELEQYDESVARVLDAAVAEFSAFSGHVDTSDWGFVRKKKQMRVYRSLQPSDDPRATLMLGTGLIPGSLDDVMDGIYCETSPELCAGKTLLKHKLLDGAVLHVAKTRSADARYDFAGIKWFAAKAPWGVIQHRDLLTYERMGTTLDDNGNELAYHVLQSIHRSEWPANCIKGVKREQTTTCYLYRRHVDSSNCNKTHNSRVQCFLYGKVYDIGSLVHRQRVAEFVVAGAWLNVVHSAASAEAKKCSQLVAAAADGRSWASKRSSTCHVCHKAPAFYQSHHSCAGCCETVCRACSSTRSLFQLDRQANKLVTERLCKFCVSHVLAPLLGFGGSAAAAALQRHYRTHLLSDDDPIGRAPTLSSSFGSKSHGYAGFSSTRRGAAAVATTPSPPLRYSEKRYALEGTDELFVETPPPLSPQWI